MKRFLLVPTLLLCTLAHPQVRYHVTDMGTLGGSSAFAFGVNASGMVTGYSYVNSNGVYQAFIYKNGVLADLGTLTGGSISQAFAINDSAEAVGDSASDQFSNNYVCSFANGAVQSIGGLEGSSSTAYAVNNSGQIAGWFNYGGDGFSHAVSVHESEP